LLQRYGDEYCIYGDDVPGTADIVLTGMINAAKLKGAKVKDEKYLFLAGSGFLPSWAACSLSRQKVVTNDPFTSSGAEPPARFFPKGASG